MRPYLTREFAGIQGTFKDTPDDFIVEEIPAYEPCGSGEHLFLRVEKQGMSTFAMMQRIASALDIKEKELGYAGLKDAQAITRQWISLPRVEQAKVDALELEGITILCSSHHTNKLRLGHLRGNRFHIRIHNVVEDAEQRALDILHVLEHTGVPNFFGEQRYGSLACNHLIGRAILQQNFKRAAELIIGDPDKITNDRWHMAATAYAQGDTEGALAALPGRFRDERRLLHTLLRGKDYRQAVLALPRKLLRLYLSAYQSHLFDSQVAMRLNSIDTIWPGDIAYIHNKGACFRVEDPETEQIRADRLEISPSGFLPGHKTMLASDQAGVIEQAILDKENLASDCFTKLTGLKLSGERRPLRVPVEQIQCRSHREQQQTVLDLSFTLPAGSFATTVLHEVMKTQCDKTESDTQ